MVSNGRMARDERARAAIDDATARAEGLGHELGDWHRIGARMRASGCRLCGRLVWIVRQRDAEGWQVSGPALRVRCEREFWA